MNTDLLIPGNLACPFDWPSYIHETSRRASLLPAISFLVEESGCAGDPDGVALDLGAGHCNDSMSMLRLGVTRVVAIDSCPTAGEFARKVSQRYGRRFTFREENIQSSSFGYGCFDIVYAVGITPYHGKAGLEAFIDRLTASIKPGGVIFVTFNGERHSYRRSYPHLAWATRPEIERMLSGFELRILSDEQQLDEYHAHCYVVFGRKHG